MRMGPAWQYIQMTFARLADEAPRTADGAASNMGEIYSLLEERAAATLRQLREAMNIESIPDVSLIPHEAWAIPTDLVLVSYEMPYGIQLPELGVYQALRADCENRTSTLCGRTLEQGRELMRNWKLADRMSLLVSKASIAAIKAQVVRKDEMWNTYLYDSKPMLPFDFFLTDRLTGGWSKSDQYPDGFREPPRTQWFLLHPGVGVEYVSVAKDGEELEPMLYIEVLGTNRWNENHRWLPWFAVRHLSGMSLISSYADRAGVTDVGYGLLLLSTTCIRLAGQIMAVTAVPFFPSIWRTCSAIDIGLHTSNTGMR